MNARVPDITLERYRLDELTPEDRASLERQLQTDGELRARLQRLDLSDAEIAVSEDLRRLERQLALARAPRTRRPLLWLLPLAAAGAAILVATLSGPAMLSSTAPTERVKGGEPSLALYRKTDGGSETLADGALAHRGDLIRLGYRAAGRGFGTIVSVDGRGAVTVHLPPAGTRAAALDRSTARSGVVLLDQAYELDDAPRWERFYFVTADHEFALNAVIDAARHATAQPVGAPLPLPRGFDQTVFSLQKEVTP